MMQRDATDCGVACVASVMAYFRTLIPVAGIRQVAGTDRQGTSMWGLIKALNHFQFEAKGIKGSMEYIDRLPIPFIAHLVLKEGMNHYVCIYQIKKEHIIVMDPAEGCLVIWARKEFSEWWSGAAIILSPVGSRKEIRQIKTRKARFISLLKPFWRSGILALTASVLYTVLGLSTSVYLGVITDHVFVTENANLLNLLSSVMVLIALILSYLFLIKSLVILRTGQIIDNHLICSYYEHLFRLPQRFFDSMRTGEIISRINDAVKIRVFINDAVLGVVVNLLIIFFSFAFIG